MSARWIAAVVAVFVIVLAVVGVVWTVAVPVAVLLGAVVVGIFAAGMRFGLTRARRSSERDG